MVGTGFVPASFPDVFQTITPCHARGHQQSDFRYSEVMGAATIRLGLTFALTLSCWVAPGIAGAQSAPPPGAAPPPATASPPPNYPAQPPPNYQQPGAPPPAGYPPGAYPQPYPQPQPTPYGAPPPYATQPLPVDTRPRRMPYTDGEPVPPGYMLESKTKKGLWLSGMLMVAIPYALGVSFASLGDFDNQSGWLILPVAGPWVTLAARNNCERNSNSFDSCNEGSERLLRLWLVIDGLVQTAGAVMFVAGVSSTKTELVRVGSLELKLVPGTIGKNGYGAYALGTF